MIKKVVIPIAGNGSRMYIETMAVSKSLLPVLNKPVIVYILEEAYLAGIEQVILVISANQRKDVLKFSRPLSEEALKKFNNPTLNEFNNLLKHIKIRYVIQNEQLGLGHAILCAKELTKDEDFCVMLGDNLFLTPVNSMKALVDEYNKKPGCYIGVKSVPWDKVKDYGIAFNEKHDYNNDVFRISKIVEKPQNEHNCNSACIGRYILKSTIYDYIESTKPGYNGEIQLTDALSKVIENEECYAVKVNSDFCDAGDKIGFVKTNVKYALNDPEIKNNIIEFLKEELKKFKE